jgi:hypothetical protein
MLSLISWFYLGMLKSYLIDKVDLSFGVYMFYSCVYMLIIWINLLSNGENHEYIQNPLVMRIWSFVL